MFSSLSKFYKYSILIILFIIVIISFINPALKKIKEKNWEVESKELLFNTREKIQDEFDIKSNNLISNSFSVENEIKKNIDNLFNLLQTKTISNNYVHLFDSEFNLIFWGEKRFLDTLNQTFINKKNQTFFFNQKGKIYLTLLREIEIKKNKFYLVNAILIEDLITLKENQHSFIDELKEKFNIDFEINYNEDASLSKDGRRYSFPVLNNYKNKIAVCTFNYPALSYEYEKIDYYTNLFQNLFLLILIILIFGLINSKIKTNYLLKKILIGIELIFIRIFLFIAEIPSSFIKNELTNPANFSSRFGFGIISSPVELLLTASLILSLLYIINQILDKIYVEDKAKNLHKVFVIIIISFLIFVYLLTWRALGASIRSIVFDSTIRYFKEFNLFPDPVIILMFINILLVGLIYLTIAIFILRFIYYFSFNNKCNTLKFWIITFLILQLLGFLFDYLQKLPQGTFLIRIIFISLSFITFIIYLKTEWRKFNIFIFKLLFASIISVTMLTYYNSELERESLKNIANDLIRVKEPQVSFMIYQTIQNYDEIQNEDNGDYNIIAFQLWKKSLLKSEDLSLLIRIYDEHKSILGEFSNTIELNNYNYNLTDNFEIDKISNVYNDKIILYGVRSFNSENGKIYILVSVPFKNSLPEKNVFSIFRNEGKGITSSLTNINVVTFIIDKNGLESNSEVFSINENSLKYLKFIFDKREKENWLYIKINNENYFVYSLLDDSISPKLINVAKPVKNFSWNLSDFFKIFIIHALIIILVFITYILIKIKFYKTHFYSFRTKLALTLVVLSIIPMIIISNYVRTIIDDNNEKIIYDNLKKDALRISELITSSLSNDYKSVFEQTKINFQIYKNKKVVFSSLMDLINLEILNNIINPAVYQKLIQQNENIFLHKHQIYGNTLNSIFLKNNDFIIEVIDFDNSKKVYLSKYDFDIFLFGILSFIIFALLIVSYLFSYQISKPINKLNIFTKAVASGDLSLEVEIKGKDEFSELAKAFNYMTKKIRENQIELAQFEREAAWKEMAKQVAHEIKNPLTPMKLLIQQLIASYNDKSDKFEELFKKVTQTVLNQIETLKNIASEFSNFARMPSLNVEILNLINVINDVITLFAFQNKSVRLITEYDEIIVKADKDHLKRVIINLIRNSFQANANYVEINIYKTEDQVVLKIKDNGTGILHENIDKIFLPNFTTKEKGMGLGLSMAKQFIENINGKIFVESTNSNGTVIQINLPLNKNE